MELKKYQVVFVDEYSIWYLIGFFDDLQDAEPELNEYLKTYVGYDDDGNECTFKFGDNESLGHLQEYTGTFGSCFDRILDASCGCIQVRGFIFE